MKEHIAYILRLRGQGPYNWVRVMGSGFTHSHILDASTFDTSAEALEFASRFPDEAMSPIRIWVGDKREDA